ncbi:Serine/threonine-protein phosphatase PP1-beta catalytic subunit [Strongyloides ratti]|uniref:Serine/threonine-protein phosphatase n=1 Tax=Strongyloides ratti TaxID=34506 RepID=A0A090L6V5_STRRB|nr:Serine/threonine-protein phosphatase PP1-beta catalytic subunit [Strongyloides ratti]CEF63853.1 Serine/threonine-protein phosphatase PP1-beta catalytic subunit [Strongyloides ratti]
MKRTSCNNYGYNMNENYYLNNKKNFHNPNLFFTLRGNQRSRSYNIDNREYHQPSLFNYFPHKNNENYSILNRNAISHSTLPTKYFSEYINDNEDNRKFFKKPFNNSIRFAPTTTTIDGANRLHSKPLNTNEPYFNDTFSKNIPQWKVYQKNDSRSYPLYHKNRKYLSYDNIYSRNNNKPINLYNYSPRNLFRYIYIEPHNEEYKNYSNQHIGISKVDYINRKQPSNFYNNNDSPLNNKDDEIYHNNENDFKKMAKSNTKQYMVYFCCFSFKWPPWRIEPLTIDDRKNNFEMKDISIITSILLLFCTSGKPRDINDTQATGEKKLGSLVSLSSLDDKKTKDTGNKIKKKLKSTNGSVCINEIINDNNNNNSSNIISSQNDEIKKDKKKPKRDSKISNEISVDSASVLKDSATSITNVNEEIITINSIMSQLQIDRVIDGIEYYKNKPLIEKSTPNNKPTLGATILYNTNDDVTLSGLIKDNDQLENDEKILQCSEKIDLLNRMILNGPKKFNFTYNELLNLLSNATTIFESESSLLTCPIPCVIYGDIHGQYSDLFRWFQINGWPYNTRTVFLGDFVDRGTHGIEVLGLLCAFKVKFPKNIFIIRGNHEEEALNKHYSFYDEVLLRFGKINGQEMYKAFRKLFSYLPLAVLIGKRVLAMHGGLSPKLNSLKCIEDIKRPIVDFKVNTLPCDLVWSDPNNVCKDSGYLPNFNRDPINSVGQLFGKKAVENTFQKLNIDMVIRGHQVPLKGSSLFLDGKIMTLFSAPGYRGKNIDTINFGASCYIDEDFVITLKKIKVTKKYRDNRKAEVALQMRRRKLNIKMSNNSVSESEKSDSQKA